MVRYNVEFIPNNDGITCSFVVNSQVLNSEVPFVPNRLVDSRGIVLYLFLIEIYGHKITQLIAAFESIDFVNDTIDEKREIKRLFDYMLNPIYVFKKSY